MPASAHRLRSVAKVFAVIAKIGTSLSSRTLFRIFRRLDALHHRHLHIHEDRKIASRIRRFKLIHGLGTILRPVHDKAEASEQLRRNLCIQCIILRKQNSSTPAISATRYSGWSNRYAMMVGVPTSST